MSVPGAVTSYAWLHIVRPVIVIVVWLLMAYYAWRHFFRVDERGLLAGYAPILAAVFAFMLILAPVRRSAIRGEETDGRPAISTVSQLARHSSLDPTSLLSWQRARRLLVKHDSAGRLTTVRLSFARQGD
jgi:poly-beta-1,6-N-acetyl-D-glucosamine biosynthesis protein PgaD